MADPAVSSIRRATLLRRYMIAAGHLEDFGCADGVTGRVSYQVSPALAAVQE